MTTCLCVIIGYFYYYFENVLTISVSHSAVVFLR